MRRLVYGGGEQWHKTFASLQAELLVPWIRRPLMVFERFRQDEQFQHAQGSVDGRRRRRADSLDSAIKPAPLIARADMRAIESNRVAIARAQAIQQLGQRENLR